MMLMSVVPSVRKPCVLSSKRTQLTFFVYVGYLDVRVIPMMILFLWQRKWVLGELGDQVKKKILVHNKAG